VVSTRFSYSFAVDPGQTEALAAAIRTHLPGAFASLLQDHRGAAAAATRAGLEQRRAVAAGIGDRLGRDAAAVTPTAGDG